MANRGWQSWASALKRETYALYLVSRDPRVSTAAKIVIGLVIAYALSPIDLIPDFIPVLGYLDDLLLLSLGIWLAIRLVPKDVWTECRAAAAERADALPVNRRAAIVIVWVLAALAVLVWLDGMFEVAAD